MAEQCKHETIKAGKCSECGKSFSVSEREIETAEDLIDAVADRVVEKLTAAPGSGSGAKKGSLLDQFLTKKGGKK